MVFDNAYNVFFILDINQNECPMPAIYASLAVKLKLGPPLCDPGRRLDMGRSQTHASGRGYVGVVQ